MGNYTVVIPTMWRYEPFLSFLKDLDNCPRVDEIILQNNDPDRTPPGLASIKKLITYSFVKNIGVNPAWNLGVRVARNNKVLILNDDIVFDLRLFDKADEFLENPLFGAAGLNPGLLECKQVPGTTGLIRFEEYDPVKNPNVMGFGCLILIRKDNWAPIPEGMKVYYGDNWIIDTSLMRNLDIYLISDMLFKTPFAATCKDLPDKDELMQRDGELYYKYKDIFWNNLQFKPPEDILLKEYEEAKNRATDINLHLPTLKRYADQCQSVCELGVRDGQSTRAFLASKAKEILSVDLYLDNRVRELFQEAQRQKKNAFYILGNSLDCNIVTGSFDLLFIDTEHNFAQLSKELELQGNKAKKYIIFHDTQTFASELLPAILLFMKKNPEWVVEEVYQYNNGLMILKKLVDRLVIS